MVIALFAWLSTFGNSTINTFVSLLWFQVVKISPNLTISTETISIVIPEKLFSHFYVFYCPNYSIFSNIAISTFTIQVNSMRKPIFIMKSITTSCSLDTDDVLESILLGSHFTQINGYELSFFKWTTGKDTKSFIVTQFEVIPSLIIFKVICKLEFL
jgi:hypothetical protein